MYQKTICGFTLIELMVSLTVAGTLLITAVPALGQFIQNNRIKSQAFELFNAIHRARSEAVKRKIPVVLCRSADPTAAPPSCGGAANTWSSGWFVFASNDGNTSFDAASDSVIGVGTGLAANVSIKTNAAADANVVFNRDGTMAAGGTARFAICDSRGEPYGRQINVASIGTASLLKAYPDTPLNSCDNPG